MLATGTVGVCVPGEEGDRDMFRFGAGGSSWSKWTRRSIMLFGSMPWPLLLAAAFLSCGIAPPLLVLLLSPIGRTVGILAAVSLQSGQFLMTRLTVSLIRTQWNFSAMVAVVLLIPPCCKACTFRAISYWRCGSLTTSLSFSMSRSPCPLSSGRSL